MNQATDIQAIHLLITWHLSRLTEEIEKSEGHKAQVLTEAKRRLRRADDELCFAHYELIEAEGLSE